MAPAGSSEGAALGSAARPLELLGSSQDPRQQLREYQLLVRTSDLPGAATDAAVYVELLGASSASSGPQLLTPAGPHAFQRGGADEFRLLLRQGLGDLQQLRVVLDGCGARHPTWHLLQLEVTDVATDRTWYFEADCWLDAAAAAQGNSQHVQHSAACTYSAALCTSACTISCTDAAVSITLYGDAGDAGPFELAAPGRSCFEQGSCDVFSVKAASKLGQLLRLKIVCDSSGLRSAWLLGAISITAKSSGVTRWFHAGRRLGRAAGLEAELDGSDTDVRGQLAAYKVTVHTSDVSDAGTSARVHVDMSGSTCCSGPQALSTSASISSSCCFERGRAGSFNVTCRELGELSDLTVWHDGSGPGSAWHLVYVEVQHVPSGQVWYFPCNQWLGSSQGDVAARRTLQAMRSFDPASLLCRYRVAVTTSNVRGAGSDANVFVVIHGSEGDTARKALAMQQGVNCFERGRRDEFTVAGADVGVMSHVVLGHDGSGLGPAWHVAELDVQHKGTGQLLKFTVNRWLDAQRPGGALQCELWPDVAGQQRAAAEQAADGKHGAVEWELMVNTGKVLGAGTDADVFISLKGSSGSFGPYTLPAGPEAFETGCRDKFKLSTPELGDLQEVVVGHNNLGLDPAWFLQGLELHNLSCGAKYVFRVSAWLDVQSGCSRTLKAVQQQQGQGLLGNCKHAAIAAGGSLSSCSYQLEIQTSAVEGAGTDAAVFVQLGGAQGQSDAMQLQAAGGSSAGISARSLFQPGSLDVFVLRGLPDVGQPGYTVTFTTSNILGAGTAARVFFELIGEHGSSGVVYATSQPKQFLRGATASFLYPRLPHLGQLQQLRVGCDGSGMFAPWHLRLVEVVHVHSGQRWQFDCHDWIDKKCMWQRVLPAVSATVV
ncbi:Lipase/lipooxygenase [Scenedesmus sp. NREL 46B-D3]|nr:Lipase/lipooxygenase [Scenedesmus sp. NREL 46B-D3]